MANMVIKVHTWLSKCTVIHHTHAPRSGQVKGKLFGTVGETAFCGKAPACMAHYLVCGVTANFGMASFAVGDIVRSTTGAAYFAEVARVVYVERNDQHQGRKLLILREHPSPQTGAPAPFFTSVWVDWERVPRNAMGWEPSDNPRGFDAACPRLATDELLQLKRVSCSIAYL